MPSDGAPTVVAKVGGSLYDLPDLGKKLRAWLGQLSDASVLIVPGGGPAADVVRELDATHGLGQNTAHWLALRALTFNAFWLKEILPGSELTATPCPALLQGGAAENHLYILDAFAFAEADEGSPGALPHTWDATSDSVALRAALVGSATHLYLLKSRSVPEGTSWHEAARLGLVDPYFPRLAETAQELTISALDFRKWRPQAGGATAGQDGGPAPR
jgi:aspartokinase-like uncharacterized kinase